MCKYKPSEVKKTVLTVSGCDLDDTTDDVQSLQKLDATDLTNSTPVSAQVSRQHTDADVECTSVKSLKG